MIGDFQGDYEKALNYLHKAEAMVESLDEMDAVVAKATWNAMGLAYNAQGQPLEVSLSLCLVQQ